MCGIVGVYNFVDNKISRQQLEIMLNKIKHRGPDDDGIFIEKSIGLGFVRLSILDLSTAGHQPMISCDENFVIVFNGEVYNYIEIRETLKHKYSFKSNTDTEVVLCAFQEWGTDCLSKFNGMFSFVIYNRITGDFFAARDRFGIKPLYYCIDSERIIFASEIKAIIPLIPEKSTNYKILNDYLFFNRTDHSAETFFNDILKLPHGTYMNISQGKVTIGEWYNLREKITSNSITINEYRETFKDSLKLRLRSDVPIGVCLSGGLDSSSIVSSLFYDFDMKELETFSAVFDKNEPTDESYYIEKFKGIIQNMHFTSPNENTFFDDLDEFIYCNTEPIPDVGPYVQFKVMELAKNFVKVTLDGQGADEQLAGYDYFYGSYHLELLRNLRIIKLITELYFYLQKQRSIKSIFTIMYFLMPGYFKEYINQKQFPSIRTDYELKKGSENNITSKLLNPSSLQDSLLDHFEYKLEHLLKWEDLNSMYFSIESRVPFLDYRLVEQTLSLPSDLLISKGHTKHILREALKDVLPREIYLRKDKKGFSNPRSKWFRSEKFKELIFDLIYSENFKSRGIFDANIAQRRFKQHLNGKLDISKEIWKWVNTELWFRKFIDQ